MTEHYQIREGAKAFELWSVVCKNGKVYENFVASGTYSYCLNVKAALEL